MDTATFDLNDEPSVRPALTSGLGLLDSTGVTQSGEAEIDLKEVESLAIRVAEDELSLHAGSPSRSEPLDASENAVASASSPPHSLRVAPRVNSMRRPFELLQQWECEVVSVSPATGEFTARLRDLTDLSRPVEEAEFSLEDVSDSDMSLVVPGGIFYWNIGYETSEFGQKSRSSFIRFRRDPAWRKGRAARASREAEDLRAFLGIRP